MKILLTGGGTGGHFYPLIAISEKLRLLAKEKKIIDLKIFFMSNSPYDKEALFENNISFIPVLAGKRRIYSSFSNFTDLIKIFLGCIEAVIKLFILYPDIVISKGGYASFPALFASRLLRIPVIIHESDSAPGRVNLWASKFASKIAVSYPETVGYFPKGKTAYTGQPIREKITKPAKEGAFEFLKLDPTLPIIVILGGSQGSVQINNAILDILPELVKKYQIIHQVGESNLESVNERISVILRNNPLADRFKPFSFLDQLAIKMISSVASLVISRAGSTIFEIALWGVPSIIIPITNSNNNHQIKNAYNYARAGACVVIEEANLTPNTFMMEIDKILNNKELMNIMKEKALSFSSSDASMKIAEESLLMALEHHK